MHIRDSGRLRMAAVVTPGDVEVGLPTMLGPSQVVAGG